ncbi:HlyD family efflux transporter periplasmic adaptor subunit, partial [uncultured Duncaniella sp.]
MDRELTKAERTKARRKKIIPYIIGIVAVIIIFAVIMISLKASVNRDDLMTTTVDRGTIETTVTGSGSVVPAFEEIINSPISTRIMEVYCKAGDSVDMCTPLLRLDLQSTETELNKLKDQIEMKRYELEQQKVNNSTRVSDLAMQVKVKEMSVNRLEVELRNERYLDSLGSGTGDRVHQAELAYNTGRLELEQMRQQLANEHRVTDAGLNVKNLDINIAEKNLGEMSRTLSDAQIRAPRRATLTFINDQIGQKISEG